MSVERQRAELLALIEDIDAVNANAILFQVRPNADAVYRSSLEPSSWYLTGNQGAELDWDPLAFAVSEAHKRGIELHAWFNPYRAAHPAQKGPYSPSHVVNARPGWVRQYGKYQWIDPGEPEAQEHTMKVFMDVVARYDIDGVHIDDYFYPYPAGGQPFPDDTTYAVNGLGMTRSDWRRHNVDTFIQRLYKAIKVKKPWVKFGISPFGIYRPGVPDGIKAGIDQYEDLSADVLKWWRNGWCDYLSPQLYWKIDSAGQSFPKLFAWWKSENTQGRHLWPGLYASKVVPGKGDWAPEEILDQIAVTRKQNERPGTVLFSALSVRRQGGKLASKLTNGAFKSKALVPASPWLSARPPKAPTVGSGGGSLSVSSDAASLAMWEFTRGNWRLSFFGSTAQVKQRLQKVPSQADAVAVVAVSRTGVESRPTVIFPAPSAK